MYQIKLLHICCSYVYTKEFSYVFNQYLMFHVLDNKPSFSSITNSLFQEKEILSKVVLNDSL